MPVFCNPTDFCTPPPTVIILTFTENRFVVKYRPWFNIFIKVECMVKGFNIFCTCTRYTWFLFHNKLIKVVEPTTRGLADPRSESLRYRYLQTQVKQNRIPKYIPHYFWHYWQCVDITKNAPHDLLFGYILPKDTHLLIRCLCYCL